MDAQQELFTFLKMELEKLGYRVYDGFLPPDGTPYPFIYLGNNTQTDQTTKRERIGNVSQTVHIWHNSPMKRGTVSQMLAAIKMLCYHLEHTNNFSWAVRNINQRILSDNTTSTPLLHGVLDIEMKFS